MNDFFSQTPKVADEVTCKCPWLGGKDGKYFRCALCGYKFKPGDKYRVVYTNGTPGAGGNPIVCATCDEGDAAVIVAWRERIQEWNSAKFWWFKGGDENNR